MAKLQQIQRLLLIIQKLNTPGIYVPKEELLNYVEYCIAIRGGSVGISQRTFQRDFNDISELFGLTIKHSPDKGYYIAERDEITVDKFNEILHNFDMLAALDADSGLKEYMLTDDYRAVGVDNMPILIDAIRNSCCVEFDYHLVRQDDKVIQKIVEPYYLRESQHRWYLLGKDNGELKLFGIDRISNLDVKSKIKYSRDKSLDPKSLFKNSFGVWDDPDIPIEDIIVSYSPLDGAFIKRLPLHHTQQILIDNEEEFRIKIRLRITNDFVMELLSRSNSLTVIEPVSLRKRVFEIYSKALERNKV